MMSNNSPKIQNLSKQFICFFLSFLRLVQQFVFDVSQRFHGHGATVYGDTVTGGAIIGQMYYTGVKDEINCAVEEISDKQIEIWSANYAGTTHGNRLDYDDRQEPHELEGCYRNFVICAHFITSASDQKT